MNLSESGANTSSGSIASAIKSIILNSVNSVPGVVSVSLVGSFCEKDDLSGISDIDTIVVVDALSTEIFEQLHIAVRKIDVNYIGLPGYTILINDTFGPRKFDEPLTLVIHLMVYDLEGHRDHVLKSPFTCYDWERTEIATGKSLKGLYPVLWLQPDDFFNARRGLSNYIEDLSSGILSYRHYSVTENGSLQQVLARQELDARHAGEYSFHIMKFLVTNYAKLVTGKNNKLEEEAFDDFVIEYLPGCASFLGFYHEIEALKQSRATSYPPGTVQQVASFLATYENEIATHWKEEAKKITFYRHASTPLNDGSFLGQGRNPGINENAAIELCKGNVNNLFSSPLLRSLETARQLCPSKTPETDPRLFEINYGDAEGLSFRELQQVYPLITTAWTKGEDPRFPGGENSEDVATRVMNFMNEWAENNNHEDVAVTHNVVIRALIGSLLRLPMNEWHRIIVPHNTPVEVLYFRNRIYLNLEAGFKAAIIDSLTGWK